MNKRKAAFRSFRAGFGKAYKQEHCLHPLTSMAYGTFESGQDWECCHLCNKLWRLDGAGRRLSVRVPRLRTPARRA